MTAPLSNSFEGGSNGTALTGGAGGNTGGTSGDYFDTVTIGTGTTLAFSTTQAAHGSLSLKVATGGTSAAAYVKWSTQMGTQTTHYGRIYVNLSGTPGNSDAFIQFQTGAGAWNGGIQLTTGRQLLVQLPSFSFLHTFTTAMTTGTWYRVEWKLVNNGSSSQIVVNLYAGDSGSATETYDSGATQTWGTSTGAVLVGWTGSHASQPAVYVDDAGISLTGFLGPASMTLSGAAALSGVGSLGAAGVFAGAGALSGSGILGGTPTHLTSHGHGTAALSGSGDLGGAGTGLFIQVAALSGVGALTATWIGTLVQPPAELSGTGTLQLSGVILGVAGPLAGNGTLSVLQATGGLVFASPGAAVPYAYPLSSQVMVAPPGTQAWTPLGSIGVVTALTYSFTCPGGADQMTATVMLPAAYRTQLFNPGWAVKITRGGHQVWSGKLDEPVPTASGWTLTASGAANRGQDYLAIYTATWPSGQPDVSVNAAISRGMPWTSAGVGTPAGAWYGQAVDSGAQTISALLTLICTRGGLTWMVSSQPGGIPGDDLSVFPLPTVPSRLLTCTQPVPRTLGGDINTIYLRYQSSADDPSGTGNPAAFATTSVQNAQSVTAHGVLETFIDISDVGTMTAGAAQAVGSQVLGIYQRASFAGPFSAHYGQLTTTGGVPVDPGCDQAGTVVKLILTDFGYGGEVALSQPVSFLVGSYAWDDLAQVATLGAYQQVDQSLTGLLSLANTVLTPIAAAS